MCLPTRKPQMFLPIASRAERPRSRRRSGCGMPDSARCCSTAVHRPGDVHVRSVVGHDQPVGLHRPEDSLDLGGYAGDVLRRLEPKPRAHRQGSGCRTGAVRGRPDVAVRRAHGDAKRVADFAAAMASSYRASPGRIARPAASADVQPSGRRALLYRSNTAPEPASQRSVVPSGGKQLEQHPAVAIDDNEVAIAARAAAGDGAFDVIRLRARLVGNRIAVLAANPESLSLP